MLSLLEWALFPGAQRNNPSSPCPALRLSMSPSRIPPKILFGFINYLPNFPPFSQPFYLLLFTVATTKVQSISQKTLPFTVTQNILMFTFISFIKQSLKVISLYFVALLTIWLRTPSQNCSPISKIWEILQSSQCLWSCAILEGECYYYYSMDYVYMVPKITTFWLCLYLHLPSPPSLTIVKIFFSFLLSQDLLMCFMVVTVFNPLCNIYFS